jgi:hypothetical protein
MASLNASTTAARDGALTADNVVDFMNEYGDEVAHAIMAENPAVNLELGEPLSSERDSPANEGAMRKLTGRIPLLPIKRQEDLYNDLESAYQNLIKRRKPRARTRSKRSASISMPRRCRAWSFAKAMATARSRRP